MSSNWYTDQWKKWRSILSDVDWRANIMLHHDCYCDECGGNVIGVRYKCMICSNYDLCQNCVDRHSSTGHAMIRISSPRDTSWKLCLLWSKVDDDTIWTPISACVLNKYLRETYTAKQIKRMNVTDLVRMYQSDTVINYMQQMADEFVQLIEATAALSSYQCNKCRRVIEGIRLTCISCVGYDLCEDCEKAHKHKKHAMIRIINQDDYSWFWGWILANTPIESFLESILGRQPSESLVNNTNEEPNQRRRRRFTRPSAENIRCAIHTVVGIGRIIAHAVSAASHSS